MRLLVSPSRSSSTRSAIMSLMPEGYGDPFLAQADCPLHVRFAGGFARFLLGGAVDRQPSDRHPDTGSDEHHRDSRQSNKYAASGVPVVRMKAVWRRVRMPERRKTCRELA